MRLRSIVLFLIDQGIAEPPPEIRVTLPLTVIPFNRTATASVAVTFPLTMMCEWSRPSGSTAHSCAEFPVSEGGWQPRPSSEPAATVTLRPTVIAEGALCASRVGTGPDVHVPDYADHGIGRYGAGARDRDAAVVA